MKDWRTVSPGQKFSVIFDRSGCGLGKWEADGEDWFDMPVALALVASISVEGPAPRVVMVWVFLRAWWDSGMAMGVKLDIGQRRYDTRV